MRVNIDEACVCSSKDLEKGRTMTAHKDACVCVCMCAHISMKSCVLERIRHLYSMFVCVSTCLAV